MTYVADVVNSAGKQDVGITADQRTLLDEQFKPFKVGDRSESAAMLAWFLTRIERMDAEDVPDAICDGSGDKGIDALTVNTDLREITLYQGKRMQSPTKSQGDNDLKHLIAAAEYFRTVETVEGLLASKPNPELRRLLIRHDIVTKIADGYRIGRLVYVTNARLDSAATGYIDAMATREPTLDVWDGERLASVADRVRRADLRPERVRLEASVKPLIDELDGRSQLAVTLIPASELVGLPGIKDLTLFSRNVRLSLGGTRINKDLSTTIKRASEHSMFVASHNGITILTLGLASRGRTLTLDGASVVNGCQSLVALYENRDELTDDLKILTKIVVLPDADSTLSDTITFRANNQNAVNARDQRSTEPIQLDLQRQVTTTFGNTFAYLVKMGEASDADRSLDNTIAAQLITATYRGRPYAAVRKVRLFAQDYYDVFGRDIDAYKLYFLSLLNEAVEAARDELHGELRSSFASIRFTVAHLVCELLKLSPRGRELVDFPERWLPEKSSEILDYLTSLAQDVANNVNGYVSDVTREKAADEEDFDPKTVFKSSAGVSPLSREVVTVARRMNNRDPGYLFDLSSTGYTDLDEMAKSSAPKKATKKPKKLTRRSGNA